MGGKKGGGRGEELENGKKGLGEMKGKGLSGIG